MTAEEKTWRQNRGGVGAAGVDLDSTGDFVGCLLQQVLRDKDRLIVYGTTLTNPPRTNTFHWHDGSGSELVEVPVSDTDRAVVKAIMESAAVQVPLKHGKRPVEFHLDDQGRIIKPAMVAGV